MNGLKKMLLPSLLLLQTTVFAQFYAEGGYEIGFPSFKETNLILQEFNIRESHNLKDLNMISGYRFGFGKYGRLTSIGLGFGNSSKKQISKNPSLLKETAEFAINIASVDASVAYRPFQSEFLAVGGALHFNQIRFRYSFGGDYQVPLSRYGIGAEIFADLAVRIRFLLKKDSRDEMFYVLKLRPYYRIYQTYDLMEVQKQFNLDNNVAPGEYEQAMSYFGFKVSLVIPFLNETEKEYYKKGGTADQERLKKKMKRMEQ